MFRRAFIKHRVLFRSFSSGRGQVPPPRAAFGRLLIENAGMVLKILGVFAVFELFVSNSMQEKALKEKDLTLNTVLAKINDDAWYAQVEKELQALPLNETERARKLKELVRRKIVTGELEAREARVLEKRNTHKQASPRVNATQKRTASSPQAATGTSVDKEDMTIDGQFDEGWLETNVLPEGTPSESSDRFDVSAERENDRRWMSSERGNR